MTVRSPGRHPGSREGDPRCCSAAYGATIDDMEQNSSGPGGFDRSSLQNVQSWRRSRSDRMLAGVCGGIGRALNIDPVLVRVVMAVLVISGPGIIFYVAAWVLMPDEGSDRSAAQGLLGDRVRPGPPVAVAGGDRRLCVRRPSRMMSSFNFGRVIPGPLVVLAVIWIVARHRRKLRRGGQQQDWAANRGWSGPQAPAPPVSPVNRVNRVSGSRVSGSGRSAWSSRQPGQWKPRLQPPRRWISRLPRRPCLDILGGVAQRPTQGRPRAPMQRTPTRKPTQSRPKRASARPPSCRRWRPPRTRTRTRSPTVPDAAQRRGAADRPLRARAGGAGEWLQQATLAIRARVPLDVLLSTICPSRRSRRSTSRPEGPPRQVAEPVAT